MYNIFHGDKGLPNTAGDESTESKVLPRNLYR